MSIDQYKKEVGMMNLEKLIETRETKSMVVFPINEKEMLYRFEQLYTGAVNDELREFCLLRKILNMVNNIRSLGFLVLLFFVGCNQQTFSQAEDTPPNIVIVLVDDMGYGGISSFGDKPWKTPQIDQLAKEGMKFTAAYASTVCSPTRASILTGKNPARLHLTNWIPGDADDYTNPRFLQKPFLQALPLEEFTIAEALQKGGYKTSLFGKWHLGGDLHHTPDKQGFDKQYMISYTNLPTWFVAKENGQVGGFFKEDKQGRQFLTEHLADKAIAWMDEQKDNPFFLVFATHVVHRPIAAKDSLVQKYIDKGVKTYGADAANYAAMHEHMDHAVGRVLQKLVDLKISENTVVIFLSDNGGRVPETVNTPYRGGKSELLEGGIRVPLIVKWPKVIKKGSINEVPVSTEDLYPTLLEIAGLDALPKQHVDGKSWVPILKNPKQNLDRDALYWHYPHYSGHPYGKPSSAIRKGDWKLLQVFEHDSVELYNLADDPGKNNNLAKEMQEKVEELMQQLNAWRTDTKVQMPIVNPNYDPNKPSGWRIK